MKANPDLPPARIYEIVEEPDEEDDNDLREENIRRRINWSRILMED